MTTYKLKLRSINHRKSFKTIITKIIGLITLSIYIVIISIPALLALDFLGAIAWMLSGQIPVTEGYWLGKITQTILKIIIN